MPHLIENTQPDEHALWLSKTALGACIEVRDMPNASHGGKRQRQFLHA